MILIVSSLADAHAVSVTKKLTERGVPYYLFDTSAYPKNIQLSFELEKQLKSISLYDMLMEKSIDLTNMKVAWWRRPLPIIIDEQIKDFDAIQFTCSECIAALSGVWDSMNAYWINNPVLDEAASKKLFQLKVAAEAGFLVPRTCVTNNKQKALCFANSLKHTKVIYKSFLATKQAWRETRLLTQDEMDKMENVKFAPVIFQEFIPSVLDLRITVIGNKIFCISVDSSMCGYEYDYRVHLDKAVIKSYDLPAGIQHKVLQFMNRLGLIYGAIDMRLTPGGDFYFLEINTAGEWQFLEEQTTLKITDYFVDFMIDKCFTLHSNERVLAP